MNRKLYKIKLQKEPFDPHLLHARVAKANKMYKLTSEEAAYFTFNGEISNSAYDPQEEQIKILFKDGTLKELTEESDQMDVSVLIRPVHKHYWCYFPELA